MTDITSILKERGQRYGKFFTHACISQALQNIMSGYTIFYHETKSDANIRRGKWNSLSDDKKEALFLIIHKIARILNGDPEYADSWDDIAGYATLVSNNLKERSNAVSQQSSAQLHGSSSSQPSIRQPSGSGDERGAGLCGSGQGQEPEFITKKSCQEIKLSDEVMKCLQHMGWYFVPTDSNSYEWIKFNKAGIGIARGGGQAWSDDLDSAELIVAQ